MAVIHERRENLHAILFGGGGGGGYVIKLFAFLRILRPEMRRKMLRRQKQKRCSGRIQKHNVGHEPQIISVSLHVVSRAS
jgi:hypothetical protein